MSKSTAVQIRRSAALLASAGAAAALALIPAGGAQASVKAEYIAGGNASAQYTGTVSGGTCALTSAPDSDSVESSQVTFSHGTKRRSADLKATFTNSENTSDKVTVKGHTDSSLTLRKKNNDLSSFTLTAGGSLKVTHTVLPSECHAQGLMGGAAEDVLFTEHKKGWFSFTRDTKNPSSFTEFVLLNADNGKVVAVDVYSGPGSHATTRALLKPGKYALEQTEATVSIGGAGISGKSASLTSSVKQTISLHGQFKPLKKHHH